jgi:hypothetical protein
MLHHLWKNLLAPYFPVSCCTVGLHVNNVIPPAALYNAWCIGVNDLVKVADIVPHLEEVRSFIITSSVMAVSVQPKNTSG